MLICAGAVPLGSLSPSTASPSHRNRIKRQTASLCPKLQLRRGASLIGAASRRNPERLFPAGWRWSPLAHGNLAAGRGDNSVSISREYFRGWGLRVRLSTCRPHGVVSSGVFVPRRKSTGSADIGMKPANGCIGTPWPGPRRSNASPGCIGIPLNRSCPFWRRRVPSASTARSLKKFYAGCLRRDATPGQQPKASAHSSCCDWGCTSASGRRISGNSCCVLAVARRRRRGSWRAGDAASLRAPL